MENLSVLRNISVLLQVMVHVMDAHNTTLYVFHEEQCGHCYMRVGSTKQVQLIVKCGTALCPHRGPLTPANENVKSW